MKKEKTRKMCKAALVLDILGLLVLVSQAGIYSMYIGIGLITMSFALAAVIINCWKNIDNEDGEDMGSYALKR